MNLDEFRKKNRWIWTSDENERIFGRKEMCMYKAQHELSSSHTVHFLQATNRESVACYFAAERRQTNSSKNYETKWNIKQPIRSIASTMQKIN